MKTIYYKDESGKKREFENPTPSEMINCLTLLTINGPLLYINTAVGTVFVQNCGMGRYVVSFSDSGENRQLPQSGRILDPEYINSTQKLTYFDDNGQQN